MYFSVMHSIHPVVGMDLHIPWLPPAPAPAPSPVPYFTATTMTGFKLAAAEQPTIRTSFGNILNVGNDAGLGVPHVGTPSYLTPVDIFASASKCHFASSSVMSGGQPTAVALLIVTNPNLNCGTPIPTPTGRPIALTTHFAGMSLGDFFAGLGGLAFDFVVQAALSALGGGISRGASSVATRLAPSVVNGRVATAAATTLTRNQQLAQGTARGLQALADGLEHPVGDFIFGHFLGGPLGADNGTDWDGDGEGGWTAADAVMNLIDEDCGNFY